jgi:hypothetical protein
LDGRGEGWQAIAAKQFFTPQAQVLQGRRDDSAAYESRQQGDGGNPDRDLNREQMR